MLHLMAHLYCSMKIYLCTGESWQWNRMTREFFFICCIIEWIELGENILNNSFEDHLKKWWQTALKNTYLMDKLKFHKNICNLNRLISNKCKNFCFRERQDQNTMLYDRNTVLWTVELFHPYVYLFKV